MVTFQYFNSAFFYVLHIFNFYIPINYINMSHAEVIDLSSNKLFVQHLENPEIDNSFNLIDNLRFKID